MVALQAFQKSRADCFREIINFLSKVVSTLPPRSKTVLPDLFSSIRRGDLEIVMMMKDLGCNLECTDLDGRNALHIATLHGQIETVGWLRTIPPIFSFLSLQKDLLGFSPLDVRQQ